MSPAAVVHPDAASLFRAAAGRVLDLARRAIADRGRFAIALAGGSTPKGLYTQIVEDASALAAPLWRQVHFFWGDERAVPPDHADSNFRMARDAMLDRLPIDADQIHRIKGEYLDTSRAALEYEREIAEFFHLAPGEWPVFDLVLLGLGPDGHTASLFPDTDALDNDTRIVVSNHVPKFDADRITLTARAINQAREVLFLVEGAGKAQAVEAVVAGPRDPRRLPAQLIAPAGGTLTWMLDAAARGRTSFPQIWA